MKTVKVPRYQIPLVSPDTGQVTKVWNEFFQDVGGTVKSYSTEDVLMVTISLHAALKAVLL